MKQDFVFNHWLAENIDAFCADLLPYLEEKLNYNLTFDPTLDLEARVSGVLSGTFDVVWLCGLLYTKLKDERDAKYSPIAAPVLFSAEKAEYSSYLIVAKDSPFESLADLAGTRLAFNEEDSFSGHHMIRYCLKNTNYRFDLVHSGAHAKSIEYVGSGRADWAAIDSTFFDFLAKEKPERVAHVRSIGILDSFPMPPILLHNDLDEGIKSALSQVLLSMDKDELGKSILEKHSAVHFESMHDSDYDKLRKAYKEGRDLNLDANRKGS